MTAHTRGPDTAPTQVLRAMGCGCLIGGVIAAILLWHAMLIVIGLAVFVGTAILAAIIDRVIAAIRNQKENRQ